MEKSGDGECQVPSCVAGLRWVRRYRGRESGLGGEKERRQMEERLGIG